MNLRVILSFALVFLMLIEVVSASSQYGSIDTYYNDEILPGKEVAKPTLKIGEPFKVRIEMTLNQTSTVFVQVCSLGGNFFEVIKGPSEFEETYYMQSLDPGKHVFEWTLIPTGEWAGGSIPINFWYQINLVGEDEPAVKGEFTVAYCTISNEYYEGGETPVSEDQPVSETETSLTPASTPSFTLVGAISVLALAFALFRR